MPALGCTRQLSNLCGIYLFEGEVHQEHKFHCAHQSKASWNQDEPSGWCFRREVDSTSFSLMIPFLAWETLNYELKLSIFFSKTAWWCLCMFVQFSAIFRLRLSELVNVFLSNEWFRNDRTGCFPLDTKHDETPYGLHAPGHDAEGDRHWRNYQDRSPLCDRCSGGVVLSCLKVPGIRKQTNGAFRWIMLNLVLGCSEALHLIVNLAIRRCVYFFQERPFNCFSVDN